MCLALINFCYSATALQFVFGYHLWPIEILYIYKWIFVSMLTSFLNETNSNLDYSFPSTNLIHRDKITVAPSSKLSSVLQSANLRTVWADFSVDILVPLHKYAGWIFSPRPFLLTVNVLRTNSSITHLSPCIYCTYLEKVCDCSTIWNNVRLSLHHNSL